MDRRQIGDTDLFVSPVGLGCWPIAGMTSLHVDRRSSLATIRACFDRGINLLDTAYCYGADGQSEKLIAEAVAGRRDEMIIATKGGIHWDGQGRRVLDARPQTLRRQCEESLRRLQTDRVDLLYLHAPDPQTPLAESAGAMLELADEGKARAIGASNLTRTQLEQFHAVCPLAAIQPPYNLLHRSIERDILPWSLAHGVSVNVYWPLMKGLLAGKLPRDHVFEPGDGRAKYPMFQGVEWENNQNFLDDLRKIAQQAGRTTAQIAVRWVLEQQGVTSALCGAKRPEQILETAGAMAWSMTDTQREAVEDALRRRGPPVVCDAV